MLNAVAVDSGSGVLASVIVWSRLNCDNAAMLNQVGDDENHFLIEADDEEPSADRPETGLFPVLRKNWLAGVDARVEALVNAKMAEQDKRVKAQLREHGERFATVESDVELLSHYHQPVIRGELFLLFKKKMIQYCCPANKLEEWKFSSFQAIWIKCDRLLDAHPDRYKRWYQMRQAVYQKLPGIICLSCVQIV